MNYSQHVDLFRRYAPTIKQEGNSHQWRGNCPFHSEKTPKNKAFCINMVKGLYHCKSCGVKGNTLTFAEHFGERPYPNNNFSINGYQKPEQGNIDLYNKYLLDNLENAPPIWAIDVIKLLKVGWDSNKRNFVFPIFSKKGNVINVKHHHGIQFKDSTATLYPLHLLNNYDDSYIIIPEGEKDVVSFLSNGFQVITSTGGAFVIPKDISSLKPFKIIYICLDNDDAGDAGTNLWIKRIKELNPKSFIRVCYLSDYVDEGGDVTDYFSIEDKSQQTFIDEVIAKSVWGKIPSSDVPDYLRNVMLSKKTENLSARDRLVFFELIIRATRYRVVFENLNGMRVRVNPGEFVKSYPKLAELCGKGMSSTMVDDATTKLESLKLIRKENLKMKRGMKFTINNWNDENGHSKSHSDLDRVGIQNINYLSSEELISKLNNGNSK